MSLNIKNAQTHKLVAELAELTGESMTRAITIAVEERLQRERRRKRAESAFEELLEIGRRCSEERDRYQASLQGQGAQS
ncbi:MAG: type II toxin-antitoxin system VapB family antitoxin [Bryobacterales bacterium]